MYFPYLRGRQYELIVLRELMEKEALSKKIIPIIEPVKLSSTLVRTIKMFSERDRNLALIVNPKVGSFVNDLNKEDNASIINDLKDATKDNSNLLFTQMLDSESKHSVQNLIRNYPNNIMTICLKKEGVSIYEEYFSSLDTKFNVIPDDGGYRRIIRKNRVMIYDRFNKLERNTDYEDIDESFSEDHLYYLEDGYKGFSDYSIVGEGYSESGFAPYAVAIHIVYFDTEERLRIKHFVSDSNDDISNPAGKFKEALEKLIQWNADKKLNTIAIREFEELYRKEAYPGLGTVKKLSIMHHIELMGGFLDKE